MERVARERGRQSERERERDREREAKLVRRGEQNERGRVSNRGRERKGGRRGCVCVCVVCVRDGWDGEEKKRFDKQRGARVVYVGPSSPVGNYFLNGPIRLVMMVLPTLRSAAQNSKGR